MAQNFTLADNTPIAAGNFTSSNFTFPAGISLVTTQFNISALDAANPLKSMTFELWRETSPGSGTFQFDHGFTWQGGQINPKTGLPFQPSMTVEVGPLAGVKCQIRLSLPSGISMGAIVASA